MISSLQVGLASLEPAVEAALVSPGDLPFLRPATVRQLIDRWRSRPSDLLAPSFHQRRGHPMLLVRRMWPEVLAIPRGQNLRDFLKARAEDIEYLVVDDPGVVRDLDTASDYSEATDGVSGHL
jgi:molybdenum cofactor cytidylyltransferase